MRIFNTFLVCFFISLILGAEIHAKGAEKTSSSSEGGNRHIGLQFGRALTHFKEIPQGFESSDLEPPLVTMDMEFRRSGERFFNMYFGGHLSVLSGGGAPQIGVAGGIIFNPSLFWFSGGLHLNYYSLTKEPYENSQYDYESYGVDLKAGMDLAFLTIGANIRYSEFTEGSLGRNEGLETLIAHEGDEIYHIWVQTKILYFIWLKANYINYKLGVSSIASKEFSTHLAKTDFNQVVLEAGLPLPKVELWFKYMKISDVKDEIAYGYQGVYFFPYYTLAEEAAFVEARWTF